MIGDVVVSSVTCLFVSQLGLTGILPEAIGFNSKEGEKVHVLNEKVYEKTREEHV